MSQVESFRDRQNSEFEVLKSIFVDELTDLRKNKNKRKWQPMDVIIKLTPQQGMSGPAEVHAQIELRVTCGEKYPETKPCIQLRNSRGLSNQQIAVLFSELEDLAKSLKGEVMIFELAQHVQKYLHENNKPSYNSFYEEMVSRKQKKIQNEQNEKRLKEDKERQVLQDEILKRQEALKAEFLDRKARQMESSAISQSIPSSPLERVRTNSRRRCMSTSESSDGPLCEHRGTKILHFDNNKGEQQIHRGLCLGHSSKGSIVYSGYDMHSGEMFAITEWILKGVNAANVMKSDGEMTDLQYAMKQISSIEQELNYLHKLYHPNLVHYLNMKYYQDDDDSIVICILQEFVVGTTCAFFLTENIPVAIDMLRYLAQGVLSALEYLHDNNVVHKDLRDTSIHIDSSGLIKLADYSLNKRLSDIYQSNCLAKGEQDFPTIQGRGGKKLDIYRFGILLLSLLKGTIVSEKEIDLNTILIPELKDFLSKCLIENERERYSAKELQQHYFISVPMKRELSASKLKNDDENENSEPEESVSSRSFYLPSFSGQSRIQNEFEFLKRLGKGAFGDVIKVKNKLDGGIYAIKRIQLDPKNKQLNKKITREVKLLSRLNHENVVRYYNSWIETATSDDPVQRDCSSVTTASQTNPTINPATPSSLDTQDDDDKSNDLDQIEKLAPQIQGVEWPTSYKSRTSTAASERAESEESSSDSDSDDDWGFPIRTAQDDSDSIVFEDTNGDSTPSKTETSKSASDQTSKATEIPVENTRLKIEKQFMYIQMEFCEKSTLRTAIDHELYKDEERIWRLFREMVEGIVHIHQQGMIHRDLKPVNIFLDSMDHVKIGDFGLATTNILCSLTQAVDCDKETQVFDKDDDPRLMSGQVGTAIYAAPELCSKAAKAIYNQKVDIYSLGIILFEMCYKPPATLMERSMILENVRHKDIILPPEMTEETMPHKIHLLRWLLDHNPSQRPTSQELLASEYLPPPELEEAEFQELLRHTLSNSQSKAYKHLITSCFAQEVTPAEDITYDMNIQPRGAKNSLSRNQFIHEYIQSKVTEVFQRHGAVYLATPLLMPSRGLFNNFKESCVRLMTHSGSIVTIPHDLRAPFARYTAWNNIINFRRYSIGRVYREKKVHGFHPRELYECAFDIISSSMNLIYEAELISVAWEIFNEIPELRDRNFTVRLNHTSLLKAVFMYCGIETEKYQEIYSILCKARDGKLSKFQIHTHFISLCLSDQAMDTLFNLFETESPVSKIISILRTISKRKGEVATLAQEGLREIEQVIANAEALGVKWPIAIVPLAIIHNIEQHSGIIFQITCELKRRRKSGGQDVVAAGGRYDKMLVSFRQTLERTGLASKEIKQHGVGISISLDKLIVAVGDILKESDNEMPSTIKFSVDIAVGCTDTKRENEMLDILRELWPLGLRIIALDFSLTEEIVNYCYENSIGQAIILESNEIGHVRLLRRERDRFQEKKINNNEITEYLQQKQQIETTATTLLPVILNRSDSKINDAPLASHNHVNINFILSDKDKLSGSSRRSFKNNILAQMSNFLQKISYKTHVEILAVFLDLIAIKTMVSFLEIDEREQDYLKSIQTVIEKLPRHKKYIKKICEEVSEMRNEKQRPVLIFYSLNDNKYVCIV